MVQQAKLFGLLPFACGHILLIVLQARGEVEQQHDRMLCHRRRAIALAVAHGNPLGAGGFKVDIVGAGGRHQDQLELGAGGQGLGRERDFIADGDVGALQALQHIFWRGLFKQLQLAEAVMQTAEVEVTQVQGRVVEEDGAAIVHDQLYLLRGGSKA